MSDSTYREPSFPRTVELSVPGVGRAEPPQPGAALVVGDAVADAKRLWTPAIRKRRSAPIMGYIGTSGHGKSASMIRDTLPSLAAGRPVLSTVEILDAWTGNPHRLYRPFTSFRQLDDFTDGDVVMDEITGIMDSHETAMPKRVRRLLPQMRRRNVLVRWSGIDWDNSNRRLRQMTQAVTVCRGFLPDRSKLKDADDGSIRLWAPNRFFHIKTYDAQKMMRSEDAQVLQREQVARGVKTVRVRRPRRLVSEWWRGSTSIAFHSYDTFGEVHGVDGSCETCGGKITDKICRCP